MSIYSDHKLKFVGNEVYFLASANESHTLQPGDFFDVVADVVGSTITVGLESLDFHDPSFVRTIGSHVDPAAPEEGPGSVETWFNCVAISVQLFHGEDTDPVRAIKTPDGPKREGEQETQFSVDAGPIALGYRPTRWRLRVTNTSHKVVTAIGGMAYVRDRDFIAESRLPLRVLNHAFGVVINALAPHAKASGHTLRFGFGEELADTLGLQGDHPLREQTKDLGSFEADGELQSIKAELVPGSAALAAVRKVWQQVEDKLVAQIAAGGQAAALQALRQKNNEWRADWEAKIQADFVTVHITALISDIDLATDIIPGFEFDLGSIEDISVHLYLAFTHEVPGGYALFLASANYEGAVAAGESLGVVPSVSEIGATLTSGIEPYLGLVHRYFAEVLVRIAPFLAEMPPIFIDARADDTGVLVRYTSDPADQRATIPVPEGHPVGGHRRPIGIGEARPIGGAGGMMAPSSDTSEDRGPLGAIPPGFELGDPVSVARLDKIETIVVVMMENRSFDHLLGYLRNVRGDSYDGFDGSARNTYMEDGAAHEVQMEPITDVLLNNVTQIPVEPHHEYSHVQRQVADGAMSGFAADLIDVGDPQFALTYYTDQQIPNYYRIAGAHKVCDHWYCAHPGPTYPNRWAELTGMIPQLENYDVDDPKLGFMRERTIFDALSGAGIDWVCYENNVSMIRMYQRYRLDDKNVLPFSDDEHRDEGFEARAAAGTLPPVVFVEPRFTGIPPLEQASDDHPPANLAVGQQFITRVYNALVRSPQWRKSLLVITYDEHGGFYDHEPPPGTALGAAEWRGKIPRLHPEGPDYLGPRVPTFVISPFVNPGTVSHVLFDHTSIIKTLLVRHRAKFHADDLRSFGPRVMMINHMGAALDRDDPRPDQPELLPPPPLRQRPQRRATLPSPRIRVRRPTAPPQGEERTEFNISLARAMLPKHA